MSQSQRLIAAFSNSCSILQENVTLITSLPCCISAAESHAECVEAVARTIMRIHGMWVNSCIIIKSCDPWQN